MSVDKEEYEQMIQACKRDGGLVKNRKCYILTLIEIPLDEYGSFQESFSAFGNDIHPSKIKNIKLDKKSKELAGYIK